MPFLEVSIGMFGIFAVGLGLGWRIGRVERDGERQNSQRIAAEASYAFAKQERSPVEPNRGEREREFIHSIIREDSARRSQS